ncbi:MAG: tetratricopeptide repeat protein [Spirochaetaceae bacterium]|jgi:tetratricopeptide (TPR) repeat protein|nr:tetratricopeptide repeat protein [Spirochaetaceae bacterium]
MKIRKDVIIGIAVILIIGGGALGGHAYRKYRFRDTLAKRIAELGPPGGGPPTSIQGLREAIALYEAKIEQHVKDAAQTGTYWKILATRLQDRGLHGEALDALERAIYYTPADPSPHYLRGVSAGVVAKASYGSPEVGGGDNRRLRYFELAEGAFLRAIELDNEYARARYGLGILYVFELDRPEDAILHLERYLELSKNEVDGMFVLARAYYMTNRYDGAIDLYDRILQITKDPKKRSDAEQNKAQVVGLLYG